MMRTKIWPRSQDDHWTMSFRHLVLIPPLINAAIAVLIMVGCSAALWWLVSRGTVRGDFALRPIPSLIAPASAHPVLAPAAALVELALIACVEAIKVLWRNNSCIQTLN